MPRKSLNRDSDSEKRIWRSSGRDQTVSERLWILTFPSTWGDICVRKLKDADIWIFTEFCCNSLPFFQSNLLTCTLRMASRVHISLGVTFIHKGSFGLVGKFMKMPVWDYSDNWSYLYFEESLWSVKYHVWQNLGGDEHGQPLLGCRQSYNFMHTYSLLYLLYFLIDGQFWGNA